MKMDKKMDMYSLRRDEFRIPRSPANSCLISVISGVLCYYSEYILQKLKMLFKSSIMYSLIMTDFCELPFMIYNIKPVHAYC